MNSDHKVGLTIADSIDTATPKFHCPLTNYCIFPVSTSNV